MVINFEYSICKCNDWWLECYFVPFAECLFNGVFFIFCFLRCLLAFRIQIPTKNLFNTLKTPNKKNSQLGEGVRRTNMTCEALHLYSAYPKGLSKRSAHIVIKWPRISVCNFVMYSDTDTPYNLNIPEKNLKNNNHTHISFLYADSSSEYVFVVCKISRLLRSGWAFSRTWTGDALNLPKRVILRL